MDSTVERLDLDTALEAARLLGRWSLISQRHGGGCSCCPGLGDVAMEEVEANLLKALRKEHALLEGRRDLGEFLRDCVKRKPLAGSEDLRRLFIDLGGILGDLEQIQRGMW
jgi:hypothetical protein